jgi:predicted  nucleic acid-binding Zn-ribbon protein
MASLRVEVLKELQSLIDERESRDRIDRGPLAETKGREHWVLHLLLRAQELNQAHLDSLIGTAYSNLIARLQTIEDRLQRVEAAGQAMGLEVRTRFDGLEGQVSERITKEITASMGRATTQMGSEFFASLDEKWKPVGESIETFAQSSQQLTKDLSDTYRVTTQSRLLLNENARRIIDLGRDLVALEESLKLSLAKVLEDGLQPLEERIAALESRVGTGAETNGTRSTEAPSGGA